MGVREIIEDSIEPLFARIEEEIHRQGPLRFLGSVVAMAGILFGATSPFGLATAGGVVAGFLMLVVLVVAVSSASGMRRLREREQELVRELAKFGGVLESLQLDTALVFRGQEDKITIAKNGDMTCVRTVHLGESSPDIPHYVTAGFDADVSMSKHDEKQVRLIASHVSGSSDGVRILLTTSWSKSTDDHPMIVAHSYIRERVSEGDQIRLELTWPGACRKFREKGKAEPFTMRFKSRAYPLRYSVTLESHQVAPQVNRIGAHPVTSVRQGNDWNCSYEINDARVGDRVGFVLDLR